MPGTVDRGSAVEDREPDGGGRRVGPVDPVAPVRPDVDPVDGTQQARLGLVLEPQPCGAAEEQHPFALALVVPEAGRARLAPGDDALDAQARAGQQRVDAFGINRLGTGKEVHKPAPEKAGGAAASTPATARCHPA